MKYIGRILLGTAILVGSLTYACPKIKNWAGETMKRLKQEDYNLLEKYTIGTSKIKIGIGGNYWKYASEDIRKNPELQKKIKKGEIDTHSLITVYKEINKGNPIGAGIYKRPIWNFEKSN